MLQKLAVVFHADSYTVNLHFKSPSSCSVGTGSMKIFRLPCLLIFVAFLPFVDMDHKGSIGLFLMPRHNSMVAICGYGAHKHVGHPPTALYKLLTGCSKLIEEPISTYAQWSFLSETPERGKLQAQTHTKHSHDSM